MKIKVRICLLFQANLINDAYKIIAEKDRWTNMESSVFWKLFTITGNVESYLGYRNSLERENGCSEEAVTVQGG